jgi:hypothetical protein
MPPDEHDESQDTSDQQDPIKNLKGEFNRKLTAQEESLKALRESNERLATMMSAIAERVAPAPQPAAADEGDLDPYDPQFVQKVTQRAQHAASEVINAQAEKQRIIGTLVSQYPELQDAGSDLHKRAVQIYESFPKAEKERATSMKTAVLEAVAELGVAPMSRRKTVNNPALEDGDDSFVMPSSRSRNQSTDDTSKRTKISQKTSELAQLMGLNMEDKKQVERLEKRAQRKVWHRYGK